MYVEISDRQTGKTTRLVDHASNELINNINDRNFKIAIVSPTHKSGERIRRMIVKKFLYIFESNGNVLTTIRDKIIVQRNMEQPRGYDDINKFYVDEFSFINDQNQRGSLLRIDNNAYYCSSPKPGDKFILHLKDYCEHNDIEIVTYDISLVKFSKIKKHNLLYE